MNHVKHAYQTVIRTRISNLMTICIAVERAKTSKPEKWNGKAFINATIRSLGMVNGRMFTILIHTVSMFSWLCAQIEKGGSCWFVSKKRKAIETGSYRKKSMCLTFGNGTQIHFSLSRQDGFFIWIASSCVCISVYLTLGSIGFTLHWFFFCCLCWYIFSLSLLLLLLVSFSVWFWMEITCNFRQYATILPFCNTSILFQP